MPLVVPTFLRVRLDRPVAVLGGGVSGEGVLALLARLGARGKVYDQTGAEFTAQQAAGHALAVFSPGFHPRHPWIAAARAAGCLCLPELDLASLFWQGGIVAVTGTNGKTTLTEFLVHAMNLAGRRAVAAGNIGVPFTRVVADLDGGGPEATVVCEVSSFQSELLAHFTADSLIWTNFAEDHLERHGSMDAYFAAKWELVLRTPPARLFAGKSVQRFAAQSGRPLSPAGVVETEGLAPDPRLAGTPFSTYPQRENFALAAAWWRAAGLDEGLLFAAARSFRVGRHRLASIATVDGVTYWNDSKATNFHAVEAALAGFGAPVVLIAGGRSKGGDLDGFVRRIAPRVSQLILIGETAPLLAAACELNGVPHCECATLEDAVRRAGAAAQPGGNVLLSPAFSSFDMFRDYGDRGDRFERAVSELHAASV
jgi:UDP-N-acetylmuramoylalanine--D-glutamate ligase